MLKAECELESAWTEVELDEIALKIINFLYSNTCQTAVGSYDEHLLSQAARNHLSAPGFSFCFPLMQHLLLTKSSNMNLLEQILTIISEHLDIRETDESTEKVSCVYIFFGVYLHAMKFLLERAWLPCVRENFELSYNLFIYFLIIDSIVNFNQSVEK